MRVTGYEIRNLGLGIWATGYEIRNLGLGIWVTRYWLRVLSLGLGKDQVGGTLRVALRIIELEFGKRMRDS